MKRQLAMSFCTSDRRQQLSILVGTHHVFEIKSCQAFIHLLLHAHGVTREESRVAPATLVARQQMLA